MEPRKAYPTDVSDEEWAFVAPYLTLMTLFLSKPDNISPWYEDFCEALGPDYEVVLWDPALRISSQLEGVSVVVDVGAPLSCAIIDAAQAAGVQLWQLISAGYDHLDLAYFRERGIFVANTPGQFSATALAEHALLLILCVAKNFHRSQRDLRDGVFHRSFGEELAGCTIGLIGLGASGTELARFAKALQMCVLAIDSRSIPSCVAAELEVHLLGGPEALRQLLEQSDYVSIHVRLTPETRGMFDRECFAAMKPSAVLINVARGPIIDQKALIDALREGTIRAAGLDVFAIEPIQPDDPLLQLENVVATPHIAGSTHATSRRRGLAAAENVKRVAAGLHPLYEVTGA